MRRLLLLFISLGFIYNSKAQINSCIDTYDIGSNIDLTLEDYKVLNYLDSELTVLDFYVEECYVFKMPCELVVTYRVYDGVERTYIIMDNKPVALFETKDNKLTTIYDNRKKLNKN